MWQPTLHQAVSELSVVVSGLEAAAVNAKTWRRWLRNGMATLRQLLIGMVVGALLASYTIGTPPAIAAVTAVARAGEEWMAGQRAVAALPCVLRCFRAACALADSGIGAMTGVNSFLSKLLVGASEL